MHNKSSESGFALLMVVFILSLATILVTAFSSETFSFIRSNRSLTDGIKAELATKAALSLAAGVLEAPDDPSISAQPWQVLSSVPSIPVPGFDGEVRIQIVDQSGKINLNSIVPITDGTGGPGVGGDSIPGGDSPQDNISEFWKGALYKLFTEILGTSFNQSSNIQTPKNSPFSNLNLNPENLVAILHDSIDRDSLAHQSPTFPGIGIESNDTKSYFFNRPFTSVDDLLSVPGINRALVSRIAPFVRVSYATDDKININTASPTVLKAMGMTDVELNGIVDKRGVAPITPEELQTIVQGSQNLSRTTTTIGLSYKIYIRAKTVSVTKWLEAECMVQSGFGKKLVSIRKVRSI